MEFQSRRLLFREFEPGDYANFSSVFSDEQVMRYALMDVITEEAAMRSYFDKVLQNNAAEKDRMAYEFAVFTITEPCFIGFADIDLEVGNPMGMEGNIGYFLLPDFWGKGYATEMASALLDFFFPRVRLQKITAWCNAENHASERIMQKAGMEKEGELRNARFKHGRWYNELQYGISYQTWLQKQKS